MENIISFFQFDLHSNHQKSSPPLHAAAGNLRERLQDHLRLQEPEGHMRLILPSQHSHARRLRRGSPTFREDVYERNLYLWTILESS